MKSVVSYPHRGRGGDPHFRGNCSPALIEDLIEQFHPSFWVGPMVGSGTEKDVCQRMGIPGWFSDLSLGFDILSDEIPVGGDFGFLHPPYHNMIVYSGKVWGEPDPRDLSRYPTYGIFLDKLNEACYRLYESLRTGAHMAILVGDLKRRGMLYPISHDMHIYGQPVNVVIKMQHNCASSRKDYGKARFIPIVHETMWITRKPDAYFMPMRRHHLQNYDLRRFAGMTWRAVVQAALEKLGGEAELTFLYQEMEGFAKTRQAQERGQDWRAKVRQTLQIYPDFESVARGVWRLSSPPPPAWEEKITQQLPKAKEVNHDPPTHPL